MLKVLLHVGEMNFSVCISSFVDRPSIGLIFVIDGPEMKKGRRKDQVGRDALFSAHAVGHRHARNNTIDGRTGS